MCPMRTGTKATVSSLFSKDVVCQRCWLLITEQAIRLGSAAARNSSNLLLTVIHFDLVDSKDLSLKWLVMCCMGRWNLLLTPSYYGKRDLEVDWQTRLLFTKPPAITSSSHQTISSALLLLLSALVTCWWSSIRCCRVATVERSVHMRPSADWTLDRLYRRLKTYLIATDCLSLVNKDYHWLVCLGAVYKFPYLL